MKKASNAAISFGVMGFSLLEMLVAMAVLAIMMLFMFNALNHSLRAWDSGARQIEAAQAARIGLDRMAKDLRYAVSQRASYVWGTNNQSVTNVIPFFATNSGTQVAAMPGEPEKDIAVPPLSGMLFAVAPIAHPSSLNSPFAEIGFVPVFCRRVSPDWGYGSLPPEKYFLLFHAPLLVMTNTHVRNFGFLESKIEAYLRNTQGTGWLATTNDLIRDHNRLALVDNCYQMDLQFATNSPSGLQFTNRWTNQGMLPAGVLVTLKVMDSKTAERIARIKGTDVFTVQELSDTDNNVVARLRREGTVEVSRFIPFLSSTN